MPPVRLNRALFRVVACCAASGVVVPAALAGNSYYVSPAGNDNADGLTPQTAWSSLSKVNATTFAPGSQVLFERGGEWRGQLSASSSGTVESPIVYGAYGSNGAPKPKFWGSDPISGSSFIPVPQTSSTYSMPTSSPVNALFANHEFMTNAALRTGSSDPATNRAYVDANPGSWTWYLGRLWVNTGATDARTIPDGTLTAAVREDVVYSNLKNNLVFRDLAVDESAAANGGYAFRVQNSDNVRIENAEAYRAGKHHIGVINSDQFVGQGLYSAYAMPDQGFGGATAYVAYSNPGRAGDDSTWIDCVAEKLGSHDYFAFYTHGEGVGDVTVQNMIGRDGAGIAAATDAAAPQNVRILGGHVDDGRITLFGDDILVDGLRVTGKRSMIGIEGRNNLVQNVVMTGANPDHSQYAAIYDKGLGNVIRFNTVILDPNAPNVAAAIAVTNPQSDTRIERNILIANDIVLRQWFRGDRAWTSDYNLLPVDIGVGLELIWVSFPQWQSLGQDLHSVLVDGMFVDGVIRPGFVVVDDTGAIVNPLAYGAFATIPEPASIGTLAAALVTGSVALRRRRRAASRG